MGSKTVLIIEDDRSLAEVVAYNLQQAGYDVLTAHDGQDGITQAQLKRPAVVLLDVMLPVVDGLDVCRRLIEYKKKGLLNSKVKVIFFSKQEPSKQNPKGGSGSKAYINSYRESLKNILAVFNLKLCGSGNMINIWPIDDQNKDSKIL